MTVEHKAVKWIQVVRCEIPRCKATTTINHGDTGNIANTLWRRKWGWLRGDEYYDHLCPEHNNPKGRKQLAAHQEKIWSEPTKLRRR